MTFTAENVLQSIASLLLSRFPNYPIYISQAPAVVDLPCFFLSLMPSSILEEPDKRFLREIGVDIVFLQQRNVLNRTELNLDVAEFLDYAMDVITYADGSGETVPLHCLERSWQTQDGDLHYQVTIKQRVARPTTPILMQTMEANNVTEKGNQ